ncbi:hypothetical protein ACWGTI_30555 [Mesorhizobium sp. ArgA1]
MDERQHLSNLATQLPGFDVNKPVWGRLYAYLFEQFFRSDNEQRAIIKDAIDRGHGKINWAISASVKSSAATTPTP